MKFDKSRREFIKKSIGAGLGIYGVTQFSDPFTGIAEALSSESRVVIARDTDVIDGDFAVDQNIIRKMLDDAVSKLSGTSSASAAWKKYFRSDDIVGIKVNTLSGRWMSSHPELIAAIVEGRKSAGVKAKNILIWDKDDRELAKAGFRINRRSSNDPKCYGTYPHVGYEDDLTIYGSVGSRLTRIVSRCTAFVNVPVLKHHTMAGVTLSLKSWFGAIHNPNKYHFDINNKARMVAACDYVPDLNFMLFSPSTLGKRQPLIICDGLMSQYDMGPGYKPHMTWNYGGLIVATDPVALDRIGAQIIEDKRAEVGIKSLSEMGRNPDYISIAADKKHNLGTNDPSEIQLIHAGNLAPDK